MEFVIKVEGGAGFSSLENQAGSRPRLTVLREHLGPSWPSREVGASTGRSRDGTGDSRGSGSGQSWTEMGSRKEMREEIGLCP